MLSRILILFPLQASSDYALRFVSNKVPNASSRTEKFIQESNLSLYLEGKTCENDERESFLKQSNMSKTSINPLIFYARPTAVSLNCTFLTTSKTGIVQVNFPRMNPKYNCHSQRKREQLSKPRFLRILKIAPFSFLLRSSGEKPTIFELRKKNVALRFVLIFLSL